MGVLISHIQLPIQVSSVILFIEVVMGLSSQSRLKTALQVPPVIESLVVHDGNVEIVYFGGQNCILKDAVKVFISYGIHRHTSGPCI